MRIIITLIITIYTFQQIAWAYPVDYHTLRPTSFAVQDQTDSMKFSPAGDSSTEREEYIILPEDHGDLEVVSSSNEVFFSSILAPFFIDL